MPENGFWAEVTVPYVDMRNAPNDKAYRLYRLYYSSVHQVVDHVVDDSRAISGISCKDDEYPSVKEYVRAEGLRRILPSELTPISPLAKDKRLEVSSERSEVCTLTKARRWSTRRAARPARAFTVEDVGLVDFTTPIGEHTVVRKRPSRHMHGFEGRADEYDLPGVPFCTYFTRGGRGGAWRLLAQRLWPSAQPRLRQRAGRRMPSGSIGGRMPVAEYEDALLLVEDGGTPVIVSA